MRKGEVSCTSAWGSVPPRGSCLGGGQTSSGTAAASRLERQGRVCPWGAEALSSSMGAPCLPLHLECAIRAHRNATVLPPWGPTARGRWKGKGTLHCSWEASTSRWPGSASEQDGEWGLPVSLLATVGLFKLGAGGLFLLSFPLGPMSQPRALERIDEVYLL